MNSGWGPYAYFLAREESNTNTNADHAMNANAVGNVEAMGIQNSYGQSRYVNGEAAIPLSVDRTTSATLDELESGRK